MGRIGRWTARLLAGFGCDLAYHNRNRLDTATEAELATRYVTFKEMIETAEVIEVLALFTPENAGLIAADEIHQIKHTAVLVCASRGGVIDEAALDAALADCTIAGARVDV